MPNIYQFTKTWPAHLSVGCVLLNEKNEVALLHFPVGTKYAKILGSDFYLLMRESVEAGELLQDAVARGLLEEMGAQANVVSFLGAINADIYEELAGGVAMRKTTLYHLARLDNIDDSRRDPGDAERSAEVIWLSLDSAKQILEGQAARWPERRDIHEAVVIEWTKDYLQTITK